jgi:hypothetical protein
LNWEKKKDSWPEMYTAPWPSIHLCTWVSSAPTHLLFSAPENQQNKNKKIFRPRPRFFFSFFRRFPRSFSHRGHWERAPVSQSKKFCWLTDIIIHHSSTGPAADEKGENEATASFDTRYIRITPAGARRPLVL